MLRTIFLLFFLCFFIYCSAQHDSLISQLLKRIASQQIVTENGFTKGNFPSYITNKPSFKKRKKDDNVFFAALINYTLRQQYNFLSADNKLLLDSIQQKTNDLYKNFQNKKGRLTYNFWRTDTSFLFPYTNWIHRIKKNTSLPDDMDDTLLSLLAQNSDSTSAAQAHAIMQEYVNKSKAAKTIEKKYRSYKTYSVWYGKNFPPVYDVCVLSNILSFVQHYNLRWTNADSTALAVIAESINNNDYIRKPIYISPYYGSTSLFLYHLARLMSYKKIPQLEAYKTKLVISAINEFANTNDLLNQVILSSAIMKWGYTPPAIHLPDNDQIFQQIESSDLPFFIGNIPSYFSSYYKHFFTQRDWLIFYHYCPAFNDALFLEYLILKEKSLQ